MKNKFTKPQRYIYLDIDGIASLHSQVMGCLTKERTITSEKNKSGKISGKITLNKVLGTFLKFLDIDVQPEFSGSKTSVVTNISEKTAENKLSEIIESLKKQGEPTIFTNLEKATEYCRKNRDAVFVLLQKYSVNAPQFYNPGQGVTLANNNGAMFFEQGAPLDSYNHRDSYYKESKSSKLSFMMAASLKKFPSCHKGYMGQTGHDAVLFRGHEGRMIPLTIFGVIFDSNKFFQIKPYAFSL